MIKSITGIYFHLVNMRLQITGINNKRSNLIEVNNYLINIKSKFKENDLSKVEYMLEELRHLQILTRITK